MSMIENVSIRGGELAVRIYEPAVHTADADQDAIPALHHGLDKGRKGGGGTDIVGGVGQGHDIQIVAINDLGDAKTNAHLTRYDTAHGKFPGTVTVESDAMIVNGDRIQVCAKRNPAELPWKELGVDVVLECTGLFTIAPSAGSTK